MNPSDDSAAVRFHPPAGLLISIVTAQAAGWIAPLELLPERAPTGAGAVVTLGSLLLFLWSARTMRSRGASLPPRLPTEVIVMEGPYRFSRNPIYLSMVTIQVGIGLWTGSLWYFAAAPIFALMLWWGVIGPEERYLERKFGSAYANYRKRVRRWL